ncbi:MAG TPA: N-acyl homoserine lactonase family protein [Candidatus Acidoferrales bacterium]|nr:N-acyl homoserine lactonase family protein [Candidatus Acidoferrales bacterium]
MRTTKLICMVFFALAITAANTTPRPPRAQATPVPNYTIDAIRYGTVAHFPLNALVMGAPKDQFTDIAMVFWVIRGGGRTILFDSGCHRQHWLDDFHMTDFLAPDKALEQAGVAPSSVTDVIVSHAHWDHMGGIDLFPNAAIWIQKGEYEYYTGAAWQPGGHSGGIDPEDVLELLRRNTRGKLHLVDGDNVEIIPGIHAFTGARHTFASQYILVGGEPPYVLASDNVYLYENLRSHRASATFAPSDQPANLAAQQRMMELAGSVDRIVPGHDPAIFTHFPSEGRVAHIR